jgi:hypothetical protein
MAHRAAPAPRPPPGNQDVGTRWHSADVTNPRRLNATPLRRILDSQHGVISRRQALTSGLTRHMLARRRHARMTAHGIVVLHFTPSQIKNEPDAVVATIKASLCNVRTKPVGIRTRAAS